MPVNKKCLFACVVTGLLVCAAQIIGNTILTLGCLSLFMLLAAWCCIQDFTLPVLLFFLPWSPILRLSPTSFSFYTFALVMICLFSVIKKRFSLRKYQIIAGLILLALSLLSKLLDGSDLAFDYVAFMMMIVLFPSVKEESHKNKHDFYQLVVFLSLGVIVASLCAMNFSEYSNIRQFIRVDSYLTIIRRCGFYGDPNFYVAQVLAALGGALSLILQEKQKKKLITLGIVVLFLLYCGSLSGSKSFVLVSAIILLLWFIALWKMRGRVGMKIVLLIFIVCAVVYIATSAIFSGLIDVIITRFSSTKDFNSFTTGRIGLWKSYFEEMFGNVKVFFLGRGFTNIKINGRASHNTIIQIFYQFGLLGAPVLFYWVVCFFRSNAQTYSKQKTFMLNRLMVFVGVFLPWLAIDMLFFDEFFLLSWYTMAALEEFGKLTETENTAPETVCRGRINS